jgi:4'-phosphopantetheinyl transferase
MAAEGEWLIPAAIPGRAGNEVHVWRASLDLDSNKLFCLEETLGQDERARAERFNSERARNHFVAARGILRNLLGRYLESPPQSIQFCYGSNGKPSISRSTAGHPLRFNLSHSHGLVLIGITHKREIGMDVELIRPEVAGEEIARRYFSQKEFEELSRLPMGMKAAGFFRCWTRKEAYIKARGEGLSIPLKSFSVSLEDSVQEVLRSPDHMEWCLQSLEPQSDYAGAVVAEGNEMQVRYLNWTL